MPETRTETTRRVVIDVAGDIATIKAVCREYCYGVGLCVTVTPTTFIYTGGEEEGAKVGLLNYPRFPSTQEELELKAVALARLLLARCCQSSVLVEGDEATTWISVRGEIGRDTPKGNES